MACIESDLKMGYYPTSISTTLNILEKLFQDESARESEIKICDPCCGEGEILKTLKEFFPNSATYGVELDRARAKISNEKVDVLFEANALMFRKGVRIFDILFLNPPYGDITDFNGKSTRLESLFIDQWAGTVKVGGYMILVINPTSLHKGAIPLYLVEKGFEIIEVLKDEDNEDYRRFSQYFILLKRERSGIGKKDLNSNIVTSFQERMSISSATSLEDFETEGHSFPKQETEKRIIFSPIGNMIANWQLLEMLERKDKKIFESKIRLSLGESKTTSIESANEGQAMILLMGGLVKDTIAERFLVSGECKKVQHRVQTGEDELTISDYYVGEMYVFDTHTKRYAKLV